MLTGYVTGATPSTPAAHDIVLVRLGDAYSLLRCTGVGVTAFRRARDPAAPLVRALALTLGEELAAADRVALWTLDDGSTLTLIRSYRAALRAAQSSLMWNHDVMVVPARGKYAIVRCTGEGIAVRDGAGDPDEPLSREMALGVGHALASRDHVGLWLIENAVVSLVYSYRGSVH